MEKLSRVSFFDKYSNDAGVTVHASNPVLNNLMKRAGKKLNIQEHVVQDKLIYGPGL
jgi:hypothetical protein